jgi:hypothetical protein
MTKEVYEFVKGLGLSGKVLDVGCMDINGSVRDLFWAGYEGWQRCRRCGEFSFDEVLWKDV